MVSEVLQDNSEIPGDFGEKCPQLYDSLVDKTLYQLTDDDEGLFVWPPVQGGGNPNLDSKDCVLFHSGGKVRTGNLMGFLGYGDERLVINSRFSESQKDGNDFFLHYMLRRVPEFSFISLDLELNPSLPFYRLFELLFPFFLRNAIKRGVYKTYVEKQFDDSHVRGVIDVPKFIRDDLPFTGRVSYHTREFSTDNHVTELVRHTIESIFCEKGAAAAMLKRDLRCRQAVQAIRISTLNYRRQDRNKIVAYNLKHPVRNGYFRPYRDLQRLCIAILRDKRGSVPGEGKKKIHGILFNGASLWEEYLNSLLGDGFKDNEFELIHPNNRTGEYGQRFFDVQKPGGIYPDFILSRKNSTYILDAKYKPSQNAGGSAGGDDWKQILSYMFRFDSRFGALLYPHGKSDTGELEQSFQLLQGINRSTRNKEHARANAIQVTKLGLEVPVGCGTQDAFDNAMDKNEQTFLSSLKTYCR